MFTARGFPLGFVELLLALHNLNICYMKMPNDTVVLYFIFLQSFRVGILAVWSSPFPLIPSYVLLLGLMWLQEPSLVDALMIALSFSPAHLPSSSS